MINGSRNRYSSVPTYGSSNRQTPQGYGGRFGGGRNRHSVLQMLLVIVLPVLFIAALFFGVEALRWAFIMIALVSLAAMWLQSAFLPNARRLMSVIYFVLIALIAISLVVSRPLPDTDYTRGSQSQTVSNVPTSVDTQNITASTDNGESTTFGYAVSQAQLRLETLMSYWSEQRNEDMLKLLLPSWRSEQTDARASLFNILAYRVPVNYQILNISGSDNDTNRTIEMNAEINKNNNMTGTNTYLFKVLMIKVNDEWYIDPDSLRSGDLVQTPTPAAAAQVTFTPAPAPTGTPGPTYVLYYNSEGGKYYHQDPNCKKIDARYLPLKSTFYYSELNSDKYKNLVACPWCEAPER